MHDLFLPWAKLGGGMYPGDAHPALCHLLDVATCAERLWRDATAAAERRRWADAIGLEPETAGRWIAFWAGSHDLGKVSPAFQGKDAAAMARLKTAGFEFLNTDSPPHGRISHAVLADLLHRPFGWPAIDRKFAGEIAAVVGGHHGVIATASDVRNLTPASAAVGNDRWVETRAAMLAALADAVGVADLRVPHPPAPNDRGLFLFLAGLIAVADWLGSNKDRFPAAGCDGWDDANWRGYRAAALDKATGVMRDLGWTGWTPGTVDRPSFGELFPGKTPRPLQTLTAKLVDGMKAPGLTLIESPMGEGKTEAALYVADRMTHAGGGRGFYVALPTQATGNGMFRRVEGFLKDRYPGQRVNLQLSHGGTELNEKFQELRERGKAEFHDLDDDAPGAVVAEEWFAQDRKQGLLAPFAVGTIDQALLSVLQVRHGFVRLFGLAGKTVILDEVHAYDAYMSVLLGRLLRWLAGLGCPVVLLSATLPAAKRRELVAAYLGKAPEAVELRPADYPRITTADPQTCEVQAWPIPPGPTADPKKILLDRLPAERLPTRLREKLAGGGCAAVICNTVAAAQDLYRTLKAALPDADVRLFHARFPQEDRAKIETWVLEAYGPPGKGTRPPKSVLVATQVVEQSLDLDFDLLVSEHAPIDLLLQRAGRLHRHDRDRPAELATPQLWLLDPAGETDGVPDFGPFEDRGDGGVYHRHILLRTFLTLAGRDAVAIWQDMEGLVESVYGEPTVSPPSEAWAAALAESRRAFEKASRRSRMHAKDVLICDPDDEDLLHAFNQELVEDDPGFHKVLRAATREIDETVTVVLAYRTSAGLSLTADGGEPFDRDKQPKPEQVRRFAERSASLSRWQWVKHFASPEFQPKGWKKCGSLRFSRLCELELDGRYECSAGTLAYDADFGVGLRNSNS